MEQAPTAPVAVYGSKCWSCILGRHFSPSRVHPWADEQDVAVIGAHVRDQTCACPCADPDAGRDQAA